MRTGIAILPLHGGKSPFWLNERMEKLARAISLVLISEFGPKVFLQKLSDPFWFQAFGCVLGFDWHSSGVTTTVTGALKRGLAGLEKDTGIFICGGKGATSRKTPTEIENFSQQFSFDAKPLVYASKMAAKVDNNALQDGYQLYHHVFVFSKIGQPSTPSLENTPSASEFSKFSGRGSVLAPRQPLPSDSKNSHSGAAQWFSREVSRVTSGQYFVWAVIQQGMNEQNRMARRYHWLSSKVYDFVEEPQAAICSQQKSKQVLDLTAKESKQTRQVSAKLVSDSPKSLLRDLKYLDRLELPQRHAILQEDFDTPRLQRILQKAAEQNPENFEQLLGLAGVGPKTIRALSLISELIYGKKPSYRDPARFSFAHGGKDGTPFPVDRTTYDQSIETLNKAIDRAKLDRSERLAAFKRLYSLVS